MKPTYLPHRSTWIYKEFEKHANLITPAFLKHFQLPENIERILILCADNESEFDVSLGDLITREPMLRLISQTFPQAEITVILKPYHYKLEFLQKYPNVIYKKTKGNLKFKNKIYFRKTYLDIISTADFNNNKWDIVIDSTSRDGFLLVKSILESIGKTKIGSFIPANILTPIWFANATNPLYKNGMNPFLPFKSHYLFLLRTAFKLSYWKFHSILSQNKPSKAPISSMDGNTLSIQNGVIPSRCCLLIDKSPCKTKLWKKNNENPFDRVILELQKLNFKVFLHRFFASDEIISEAPQYILSSPICIYYSLDELAKFYLTIRPKLVIGIDTGVIHFLKSLTTTSFSTFISIFTNESQDPIVWSPPNSLIFSTLDGIDNSTILFNLTPSKLIRFIKNSYIN